MSNREKVSSLKSKTKRTTSSRNWLLRQLNDEYVIKSKELGYRSRAAFKLIDIDDKYKVLHSGQNVIDLGCAPGGWLQVVSSRVKKGKIIGLDLQSVEAVDNTKIIKGDFTESSTVDELMDIINGDLMDVVLSDMAAPACGINGVDCMRIMNLVREVFEFCKIVLNVNGTMVAKVLRGGTETELLTEMKQHFKKIVHYKPKSSRKDSAEMYVIATGFKKN